MRATMQSTVLFLMVSVLIVIMVGCEGDQGPRGEIGPIGPTGPQGEPGEITPFISGLIRAPRVESGAMETHGIADIVISKIPGFPAVDINGFTLGQSLYSAGDGLAFYSSAVPIEAGDPVTLTVDYLSTSGDSMRATASLTIPGDFSVVPDSITAGVNDTLRLDWTPSSGADGYYVSVGARVEYTDTLGDLYRHTFALDTVVTDTFFEMAATPLFPEGVAPELYRGIQYTSSYVHVSAVSGPVFPEDEHNISGDGYGFVYGENFGPRLEFELELPVKASRSSHNDYSDERLRDYLLHNLHAELKRAQ